MAKTLTLIKDGEQVSFDKEPAAIFKTLRNGRYTVTIAREKEPRSLDQNALMWLWFTCMESETGTPKQDIHDYYCRKFNRKIINWNGRQEVIAQGTSKLNKDEFATFLNNIQADAASEFGIRLPNPEDRFFEEFYQMYR